MKTFAKLTMIAAASMIIFTGCKKGENDPFLSLKSRDARITAEWALVSADYTEVETSSMGTTSTNYTYDGDKMTEKVTMTYSGSTLTDTDSYDHSEEFEFVKDGTFSQKVSSDGSTYTIEGFWAWMSGVKEQELKNKEAVVLTYTTSGLYTSEGQSINPSAILVFDKLSSKEFVVLFDTEEASTSSTTTKTGTMTYEKQ